MSGGAIFEYGWREDYARAGDEALAVAEEVAGKYSDVSVMAKACAYAAIAQAHYAAANIRTRPIRDALLSSVYTTGPTREDGCTIARFDHTIPPYGPQYESAKGHGGDHVYST